MKIKPTARQIEFQDWEFGIFLHFGIRSFHEGHKDWDGKPLLLENFNPTELDCEDWAKAAADSGAKYMVLTAKHHDGFANWPSKYTDFGVANTPWKDGKGDVVREYVDACRKYNLAVGIYYSPAEWGDDTSFEDEKDYDDYFINQISELLTGYGQVDLLWFDGCGSENHEYNWPRITAEIRKMQPKILIFNMGDPDYRWVGNECGVADTPTWNVTTALNFSIMTEEKEKLDAGLWLPAECDFMMRDHNWFYNDCDVDTVKSPDELFGIYHYSVGRGCNMLLNIGPDRRGLFPDEDKKSLLEFGQKVKELYANQVVAADEWVQDGNCWKYTADKWVWIDHMVLQEDLTFGENVKKFKITAAPYLYGKPITVFEGNNIGHKAICTFPLIRTKEICVEVLETYETPVLKSITAYK